jgi:hypothetical protein
MSHSSILSNHGKEQISTHFLDTLTSTTALQMPTPVISTKFSLFCLDILTEKLKIYLSGRGVGET